MRQLLAVFVAVLMLAATSAHAAKTLDTVVGEPVTIDGMTASQIGDRAMQCLQAASSNVADKVTPLRDGDVAYAIVITGYMVMISKMMARSRMSVQAKDGRFRVVHSDIEIFRELTNDWGPVYMSFGGGAKQVQEALEARSAAVAGCITKTVEQPGGDW